MKRNFWSENETKLLIELYQNGFLAGDGKLENFCISINRTKQLVCRKAKQFGLTNYSRKLDSTQCDNISKNAKKRILENGHPKGFLGKKHKESSKIIISGKSKQMWNNPPEKLTSNSYKQMLSDNASKSMANRIINNPKSIYSRGKTGTITIGLNTFYARSSWEANVASYLEFLKSNSEILKWEYEPRTFWFEKIKRGVRSYKPDFLITKNNHETYFIEVKGYMDSKSKTKLNRMRIYYPEIKIEVLDKKRYNEICKQKSFIPNWGLLD